MAKNKKKPSSKLEAILKIVQILTGIATIAKTLHDLLKG